MGKTGPTLQTDVRFHIVAICVCVLDGAAHLFGQVVMMQRRIMGYLTEAKKQCRHSGHFKTAPKHMQIYILYTISLNIGNQPQQQ